MPSLDQLLEELRGVALDSLLVPALTHDVVFEGEYHHPSCVQGELRPYPVRTVSHAAHRCLRSAPGDPLLWEKNGAEYALADALALLQTTRHRLLRARDVVTYSGIRSLLTQPLEAFEDVSLNAVHYPELAPLLESTLDLLRRVIALRAQEEDIRSTLLHFVGGEDPTPSVGFFLAEDWVLYGSPLYAYLLAWEVDRLEERVYVLVPPAVARSIKELHTAPNSTTVQELTRTPRPPAAISLALGLWNPQSAGPLASARAALAAAERILA